MMRKSLLTVCRGHSLSNGDKLLTNCAMVRSCSGLAGIVAALMLSLAIPAQSQTNAKTLEKKIIEYGWDVPSPDYVRAHVREMEQKPFDGIIFRLQGGANVFEPTPWDESKFAADVDNLANTQWEKFTDNFASMLAASNQDWFDDNHWTAIEHNTAIIAKAAKTARCVGICFDPEPYGANPWTYAEAAHKDSKTFAEYEAQARKRGAQFIKAVERELPNPKILTFFQLSLFGDLCKPMKPEDRATALASNGYGLLPAFLEGMLDGAGPGVVIIDGNENAYYYSDARAYFDVYHLITQRALHMIDPALWPKYRAQVQAGQALYIDQYYGLRTMRVLGNYMTPAEQSKWFEHNVYWALYTTGRYVWCYSERMNWWTNTTVPEGAENAIRSARAKIANGEPLGFDLRPIAEAAAKRERGETGP